VSLVQSTLDSSEVFGTERPAFGRTCVATIIGHGGEDLFSSAKRGQEVVEREFSYQRFVIIVHREIEQVFGVQFCK